MEHPYLVQGRVIITDKNRAAAIHNKGNFGYFQDGRLELSLEEALYLKEKKHIDVFDEKGKELGFTGFVKYAQKKQKRFWIRYCVFKDMRSQGFILKTAFKYGGDFRVYNKGDVPGKAHAEWILYVAGEHEKILFSSFAAVNRVAHSVKKRVLFAVVDDEDSVTYYEIKWMKV